MLALVPLIRGCAWCCDQNLHWMLGRDDSLLCGCHSPVGDRVGSPVVGVEAPRSISKLQYEVDGTGALPLGQELLRIPPQVLSTKMCDSVMLPATWCVCPQSSLLLAPGIISAMGVPIIGSDVRHACAVLVPKPAGLRSHQRHTTVAHCGSMDNWLRFQPPTSTCGCPKSLQNPRQWEPCPVVSMLTKRLVW